MKLAAAYVIYDDTEYLEVSLDAVSKACDKVYLLVNPKPWNGTGPNNDHVIEHLKKIAASNAKIHIETGTWKTEHDTRNAGLDLAIKDGMDFSLIVDTDEVYSIDHLYGLKNSIPKNPGVAVYHTYMSTYWKKAPLYRIEPRENFQPVICVNNKQFRFYDKRAGITLDEYGIPTLNYSGTVLTPNLFLMHHLSYERDDAFVKTKLTYFSHSHEILNKWYEEVWLKWQEGGKDFHPVNAPQYHTAVKQNINELPEALKKHFEKENQKVNYKVDSNIMNLLK